MPPTTAVLPERSETPCVSSEALLAHAMHCAIVQADPVQVLRMLDSASELPVAVAIRSLWLPLAEELSVEGSALDPDGRLGRLLRTQIRAALVQANEVGTRDQDAVDQPVGENPVVVAARPPLPITHWLVPASPGDTTAAYLAALVLNRQGMGAGVWPWPLPSPGHTLVVGDRETPATDQTASERIPIRAGFRSWPPLAALVA